MKSFLSILLFALIFQFSGCDWFKKSDPKPLTELQKLPPATQVGKNTFGCIVNGKAVVAPTTVDVTAVYQQGILQIGGGALNPQYSVGLVLYEKNYGLISVRTYPANNYPDSFCTTSYQKDTVTYCQDQAFEGSITITKIDRTGYIISGLFEFTAAAKDCDTLKITSGRFDIKYIP
jgi:hypothetical protein